MGRKLIRAVVGCVFVCGAAQAAQGQLMYLSSFEPAPAGSFVLGPLHGQNGWTGGLGFVSPLGANVSSSRAASGTHSIEFGLGDGLLNVSAIREFNITPSEARPLLRVGFSYFQPIDADAPAISLALFESHLLTNVGVDSAGALSANFAVIPGAFAQRGEWHRIVVDSNFHTGRQTIELDGISVGSSTLRVQAVSLRRVHVSAAGSIGAPLRASIDDLEIRLLEAPPSCPADFSGDGSVDGDDLAEYINCYFAAPECAGAEVNADGQVNADDLADFINVFFAGC